MLAPAISKEDELHWLALCLIPGLGTVKAGKLVAQFQSPQAIFRASRSELESRGLSGSVAQTIASGCTFDDAVEQQQKMLETGAVLVPISDSAYPARLREIFDPPIVLFARGRLELLQSILLGVVGTRRPTPYGIAAAERLARRSGAGGAGDCERHGARHRYRGPPRGARRGRRHGGGVRLRRGSYLSSGESQARDRDRGERLDPLRVSDGLARISAELSHPQSHHQRCGRGSPGGGGRAILGFRHYGENGAGSATRGFRRTREISRPK